MSSIASELAWMNRMSERAAMLREARSRFDDRCPFCGNENWDYYLCGSGSYSYCGTCGNLRFNGITTVIISENYQPTWVRISPHRVSSRPA